MAYVHMILEVHCSYDWDSTSKEKPDFCIAPKRPGYHCIENNCRFVAFTYADYELAYSDANGIVPDEFSIGFGGSMESETFDEEENRILRNEWKKICKKKIGEAYQEYMQIKKKSSTQA